MDSPSIKTCSFCKQTGHFKSSSDGTILCPALKSTICGICEKPGHTTESHLRRIHGKDYKPLVKIDGEVVRSETTVADEEEYEDFTPVVKEKTKPKKVLQKKSLLKKNKLDEAAETLSKVKKPEDPNSWANKAKKGQEISDIKDRTGSLKKSADTAKAKEWLRVFPTHMNKKYGPFWAFRVVGTKFDFPFVKEKRTAELYQSFERQLFGKYGENWIFDIEGTDDDCACFVRPREARHLDDYEKWLSFGEDLGVIDADDSEEEDSDEEEEDSDEEELYEDESDEEDSDEDDVEEEEEVDDVEDDVEEDVEDDVDVKEEEEIPEPEPDVYVMSDEDEPPKTKKVKKVKKAKKAKKAKKSPTTEDEVSDV